MKDRRDNSAIEDRLKALEKHVKANTEYNKEIKNLLTQGQGGLKALLYLGSIVGVVVAVVTAFKLFVS